MCNIENVSLENAQKIYIEKSLWGYDDYKPEVYFKMIYNDNEFVIEFTVFEQNPTRVFKKHFDPVCEDSCVELFLNFSPKTSKRYINFEVNANGIMNPSFRLNRYDSQNLELEEIERFDIANKIYNDYWKVSFKVGFDFVKKYYPDFNIDKCDYLIGNAYKCGDKTPVEHYIALFDVGCEKPDFHRPEYFDKFKIVR